MRRRWRWWFQAGTRIFTRRRRGGGWRYRLLGRTVDDAAGEAFDKVAKLLGLRLSGRAVDRCAGALRRPAGGGVPFAQIKTKAHLHGQGPADEGGEHLAYCRA